MLVLELSDRKSRRQFFFCDVDQYVIRMVGSSRVTSKDIPLQTVELQMRRLLMSRLIRIFTVYLVNLFFIPIIKI